MEIKQAVHDFWNEQSCGEALYLDTRQKESYAAQLRKRYELEPYIPEFAEFRNSAGKRVLEIGVGLGADHQMFAEAGAILTGIDLTERAIEHTAKRFELLGLRSQLQVGDAENLPFDDNSFDVVYSWGVLHHSPDTPRAVREVLRVLRPGGSARIMIYYKYSIIGFMLWARYGLLALRPWRTLDEIYAEHLESPGTKAYSFAQTELLFEGFNDVTLKTELTHGDLLTSDAGQRHRGVLLTIARMIWPRWFIRSVLRRNGLFLLIRAIRPSATAL